MELNIEIGRAEAAMKNANEAAAPESLIGSKLGVMNNDKKSKKKESRYVTNHNVPEKESSVSVGSKAIEVGIATNLYV